mgnify:CR=1 FL=1
MITKKDHNDHNDHKKTPTKYVCKNCDFSTSNKKDYNRHLATRKHKMITMITEKDPNRFYCDCGNNYSSRSGLCRHKKQCFGEKNGVFWGFSDKISPHTDFSSNLVQKSEVNNSEIDILKEGINLLKTVISGKDDIISTQNEIISTQKNNIGSYNNNTINNNQQIVINVNMLNEQFKDALTMEKFIDKIKFTIEDVMDASSKGNVECLTNLLVSNLNELDVEERPVHCTDLKRCKLFVKDSEGWKENKGGSDLKTAVRKANSKKNPLIKEWQQNNMPDGVKSASIPACEKFNKMAQTLHLKDVDQDKIVNNIKKEIHLKPEDVVGN